MVENALLHSPLGGFVRFTARQSDDGRIAAIIDDNVPGILESELPRVRDRFFRGRNSARVGSGLDLAIVDLAAYARRCIAPSFK
jgi:two-component system, OmpR family, sensor histidine kinase QseC